MYLTKSITRILSFILLSLILASCTGSGCVLPEQFEEQTVVVQANPTNDGVTGTYNNSNGGQLANWHDTGLKTNGSPILITISGGWGPWGGNVSKLSRCNFCAKRDSLVNPSGINNCICYDNDGVTPVASNESPMPENAPNGNPLSVDCSQAANQNDPAKCSCTTFNGKATDYGVYHVPLNYENKSEIVLVPDRQSICKYDRGTGLYLGLFGSNGAVQPVRLYHLFAEEEICNVGRNAQNQCLDSSGNDVTQYVFRSANYNVHDGIVKDDNHGNDSSYTVNAPNDPAVTYYTPNQEVKVMIYDSYYSDNTGSYVLTFLGGINNGSTGNQIIQYLVSTVENAVLGQLVQQENGSYIRQGGMIQFFYNAITNDSSFITILQLSLVLYILFFGVGILIGVIEINRKELNSRIIKIGLVVFFTTSAGWYWYNSIIVNFFQNGMNYVISMFMTMSDSIMDTNTADQITISQMGNYTGSFSNTGRFAYADLIIKKLISASATKKVWGLVFGDVFGLLYVIIFYCLVAGFIAVMLYAATIYLLAMLKLSLVLALGPIFICFTLFAQTNDMFKKWLAFLGARALEIVFLFLILYSFLYLIDQSFTSLLYVNTCYRPLFPTNFGFNQIANPFQLTVLITNDGGRTLVQWIIAFTKIAGLIFIMKLFIDKMPALAQSLIDIGGAGAGVGGHSGATFEEQVAHGGGTGSSVGLAGQMFGSLWSLTKQAASRTAPSILEGFGKAGAGVARATGISGLTERISDKLSIPTPAKLMINSIINDAARSANEMGLTGKDREQHIRAQTLRAIQTGNSKLGSVVGVNTESALKALDQKLVAEPLRAQIKEFAKQLKQGDPENVPLGEKMAESIKQLANNWADTNLAGGRKAIQGHLENLKGFMSEQGELTTTEAARKFANNPTLQNKYLQHLKDREFEQAAQKQKDGQFKAFDEQKPWDSSKTLSTSATGENFVSQKILNPVAKLAKQSANAVKGSVDFLKDDVLNNPKSAARSFVRKSEYAEKRKSDVWSMIGIDSNKGFSIKKRINLLDKDSAYLRNQHFLEEKQMSDRFIALNYGLNGGFEAERDEARAKIASQYDGRINAASDERTKETLEEKKQQKMRESDQRLQDKKKYLLDEVRDKTKKEFEEQKKTAQEKARKEIKTIEQEAIKEVGIAKREGRIKDIAEIRRKAAERISDIRKSYLGNEAKKQQIEKAAIKYSQSMAKALKSGTRKDLVEALEDKFKTNYLKDEFLGITSSNLIKKVQEEFRSKADSGEITEDRYNQISRELEQIKNDSLNETKQLITLEVEVERVRNEVKVKLDSGEIDQTKHDDIIKVLDETKHQLEAGKTHLTNNLEAKIEETTKAADVPYVARQQTDLKLDILEAKIEQIRGENDIAKPTPGQLIQDLSNQQQAIVAEASKALTKLETEIEAKVQTASKQFEDGTITQKQYEEIIKQTLVATELKIEFGASVGDVLLQEINVGLKESNVLLGVPDATHSQAALVAKTAFAAQKAQCEMRIRMNKIDKRIMEMEKHNLQQKLEATNLSPEEIVRIRNRVGQLEQELSKVSSEVTTIESESQNLDSVIKALE